jgi:hypothetical protein
MHRAAAKKMAEIRQIMQLQGDLNSLVVLFSLV